MNFTFIRQVGWGKYLRRAAVRQFYKRVLKKDHKITLPTGPVFNLPQASGHASEVYTTNCDIDWGSEKLFARFIQSNKDFLDIGAHIGYYALYMAPLARRVFAFEPDPRLRTMIEKNLDGIGNVTIVNAAMGETPSRLRLSISSDAEVSHLVEPGSEAGDATVEVEVLTVDGFATDKGLDVGAIKIDVEGWDLDVIRGARQTMSRQQPLILAEIAPVPALSELAAELGYSLFAYARKNPDAPAIMAKLTTNDPRAVKMVFIVPPRLENHFQSIAMNS